MATHTTLDNPQIADRLAETYATSLFQVAEAAGGNAMLDEVNDELDQLGDLLEDQPQLNDLLTTPLIRPEQRRKTIDALFQGRVTQTVLNFLHVLNDNGRLGHFSPIAAAFADMFKQHHGQVDVYLQSATELDRSQLDQIRDRLSQALGREAVVHPQTVESLIGGLRLRVGDKLIDASVASHLQQIKRQLLRRGQEEVRQGRGLEGV